MPSRTLRVVATAATVILGATALTGAANADDLFISDYAFVLKPGALQEPSSNERLKVPFPKTVPLVFWTKLAGNSAGVERLKGGGFHLVHLWSVNCGAGGSDLDEDLIGEKPLSVDGRIPWPDIADELAQETTLRESGLFDWRTASQRDSVVGCQYTVRVLDERGDELYCTPLNGPCVLKIEVKRQ